MAKQRDKAAAHEPAQKETLIEQISSFVGFFVYLLVLKSFFIPLFVIPTGSMAETLYGAHSVHTCPNCGTAYPVGWAGAPPQPPPVIQCPNCGWHEAHARTHPRAAAQLQQNGIPIDAKTEDWLHKRGGDRIMVHGWPYDLPGFGPARWDVVVFKVPKDNVTNYIKRLIGKPGETIELIDGDVFVTPPGGSEAAIARKPVPAQASLWFPYYNHDYPPEQAALNGSYFPRWVAVEHDNGWGNLEERELHFDGLERDAGEVQFVTQPGATLAPGIVADIYGYNGFRRGTAMRMVRDVRLSTAVRVEEAREGGYVELSLSKYADRFYARLYADGRVELSHQVAGSDERKLLGSAEVRSPLGADEAVHLSLSNVDYRVTVAVDGAAVLQTSSEQYDMTAQRARELAGSQAPPPMIRMAGGNVRARMRHIRIERDVYYTNPDSSGGYGTQGQPIALDDDSYYVLGDNSPNSMDSRFSFAQQNQGEDPVGPYLKQPYQEGVYQLGTVPRDQLIGPAFFVYWPGMGELVPGRVLPRGLRPFNVEPNPGRIRWIH